MRDLIRLLAFVLRLSGRIRHLRRSIFFIAVAGVLSGLAGTGMIALINSIVTRGGIAPLKLVLAFAGLCIALPVSRFVSQLLLINMSQSALLELRLRLSRQVLEAPLRQIEKIGAGKLLATLTNDVGTIVDTLGMVPVLIMHMTLVVSCFVYLGWLDWRLLIEVIIFAGIGVVSYQLAVRRALLFFYRSRRRLDEVLGQIRSMIEGTKELKMHRARRQAFLDSIESSTVALQRENKSGQMLFAAASSWGQVLFYFVIGLVVLVMPRFHPTDAASLTGYTIILFQIMAPLEVLLTAFPNLSRATVAARTVEELGFSLESEAVAAIDPPAEPRWETLELNGISHTYRLESNESFLLGPVDLTFQQGELVFIVGGNGSGKTTLAKLLVGLYAPESGEIRIGSQTVTDETRDSYRERFSVVFSDFFVFEKLLGLEGEKFAEEARRYLHMLRLDSKVKVEGDQLSTIELSQGQRKRLALLTAYLEDRPIYLFDEWAADQDPLFKNVFYMDLLPELKRRGKTVFVITHDDRYFHVADRIVKLDYGKIDSDHTQAEWTALAEARSA